MASASQKRYEKFATQNKVAKYAVNKICLKNLWKKGEKKIDKKKVQEEREDKECLEKKEKFTTGNFIKSPVGHKI